MDNLLADVIPERLQPAPDGWRFVGAAEGKAQGRVVQDAARAALVIEHAEYTEGSRWEQVVTGVPAGTLLTLAGHVHVQGPCLRNIGENQYMSGIRLALGAGAGSEAGGGVGSEAVDYVFPFLPTNPDGTMPEEGTLEGELALVVPEGANAVRASAELSGLGSVAFSSLTLTGEAMDAGRMNDRLVDRMKAEGEVRSRSVEQAFRAVARHHFLPGRT